MNTSAQVLITRPEAAKMLGVSRDTFKRLVKRGVIEEVRLAPGMHPRFRVEDVIALARQDEGDPP